MTNSSTFTQAATLPSANGEFENENVLLFFIKHVCLIFKTKQSITKEFQSLPSDVKERLLNISNKNIIVDT